MLNETRHHLTSSLSMALAQGQRVANQDNEEYAYEVMSTWRDDQRLTNEQAAQVYALVLDLGALEKLTLDQQDATLSKALWMAGV